MVWASEGWIFKAGAIDFAGGLVVHMSSGFSALVLAILLGPRKGYGRDAMPPTTCRCVSPAPACCGLAGSASMRAAL